MRRIIMIFLDAFSSEYLKHAVFLRKLSSKGDYFKLKSLFAFQGIGAAIFSGTSPNTNGVWNDYVYSPSPEKPSFMQAWKLLTSIFDLIPHDDLNKYLRYFLNSYYHKPITPNLIPSDLIGYFKPRLTKSYLKPGALGRIKTIFDEMRQHHVRYYVRGLSGALYEKAVVKGLMKNLEKDYDLYLVKFSSLDRLGHKFGPQSAEVKSRIRELDSILQEVVTRAGELGEFDFIIFSDHGMSPVKATVDLDRALHSLPVRLVKDYLVFINSTVACFWFKNLVAKRYIVDALSGLTSGLFLDEGRMRKLRIDRLSPEYFELAFALREGYVFFPDFYRRRSPPKGMHGYAFQTHDTPFLLLYSREGLPICRKGIEEASHVDIMPTMLGLLGLPCSTYCEGENLLKNSHRKSSHGE